MKYRKKPVEVEAVQWTDENFDELKKFCGESLDHFGFGLLTISTLEGEMIVSNSDYIIKGVHGEFYPCKPDIFVETYEVVE